MTIRSAIAAWCLSCAWFVIHPVFAAETYEESVQDFLHTNFDHKNAGMVVGIVDEHGSRIYSAGKLDNSTDREVDGDTVFEIGSVTKTFTSLLLETMIARGEMNFDDPVAKYLPDSVTVPAHGGKQITLFNLSAQDSGLPFNADNHKGADWAERFSTYTAPLMYEFLAGYQLPQDPGEKFQYSNIGMGLLGHAMERKSGKDFETLVVERICRPLHMDSTGITLTPEQKARLALGHDEAGKPEEHSEMPAIAGAGALRSTANDLLKFAAAEAGINTSPLTPLMEKTHVIRHDDAKVRDQFAGRSAMPWFDEGVFNPPGSDLLGHAGGRCGCNGFVGFDLKQHVGVVVLTNQSTIHSSMLGWRILQHSRLNGVNPVTMAPLREINGAGVALDIDPQSGLPRVTKVFANSPAQKAGLTVGRIIHSINGVPTANKNLAECVEMVRGKSGTLLKLELADIGQNQTESIELLRQTFLLDE